MGTIICPKCGTAIPDTSRYCDFCGCNMAAEITRGSEPIPEEPLRFGAYDRYYEQGGSAQYDYGQQNKAPSIPGLPETTPGNSKARVAGAIVGLGAVVVIFLVIPLMMYWHDKKEKDERMASVMSGITSGYTSGYTPGSIVVSGSGNDPDPDNYIPYVPSSLFNGTTDPDGDDDSEPKAGGRTEAYETAVSYLSFMPFSHDGLIEQLEFEHYSSEDAKWAADNCGADWDEQAIKMARSYVDLMPFSRNGLIDQLSYEKFTYEQAKLGADTAFDEKNSLPEYAEVSLEKQNAVETAKNNLEYYEYSHESIVSSLVSDGFTSEEAIYGADNCGADWYEQAVKCAERYKEYVNSSKERLIEILEHQGFTKEEATYGAEHVGL